MTTLPQTLNPPLPRLRGGCLLPESVEVEELYATVGRFNVYQGLLDDAVYIVESERPFSDLSDRDAHIFPQPMCAFENAGRYYRVVPAPEEEFYPDLPISCRQGPILEMILSIMEICAHLEGQSYDLDVLDQRLLYRQDGQWRFLVQPPISENPQNSEHWIRRFIHDLLYRKLERGNTRDLENPLRGLHFATEAAEPMMAFLNETCNAENLYLRLDVLRENPLPEWDIAGMTDPGLERERNEDAFGHMSFTGQSAQQNTRIELVAVADGMGGHQLGDRASDQAIYQWFREIMGRAPLIACSANPTVASALAAGLEKIQHSIAELGRMEALFNTGKPGTTFVGGALIERNLYLLNCGDSRAYRLGDNHLERLTRDHSLIQTYIDQGDLTPEEAFGHQASNVITSFVGIEPRQFRYDRFVRLIHPGDRLLFCSDGLTDMVPEEEIQSILANAANAHQACKELVDAACEAGGRDNITVLVVIDQTAKCVQTFHKEEHQK